MRLLSGGGAENTVITGFKISGGVYGVRNLGANTVVDNVIFEDIDYDGVHDRGEGSTIIRNSEFNDMGTGIYSEKASSGELRVYRNKFRNNYYDMYLEGGADNSIFHNTMHDGAYGIYFDSTSGDNSIVNNIFEWKYLPAVVSGAQNISFNSNLLSGNTYDYFPAGYNDPNLVVGDANLTSDLTPTNSLAIDRGVQVVASYILVQNAPDIGAVETSPSSGNSSSVDYWNSQLTYNQGDKVKHVGRIWQVIGTVAAPGWEPGDPTLWAIWEDLGPA